MSQVNIIVASGDPARLYAALEAAMAWAALGRQVQLFCQGEAVACLRRPIFHVGDRARQAAGQPDLAAMLVEARELRVELFVCQSGLALADMAMDELAVDAAAAGLIGFLSAIPPGSTIVSY
jgi:predicted peroxiredoxin